MNRTIRSDGNHLACSWVLILAGLLLTFGLSLDLNAASPPIPNPKPWVTNGPVWAIAPSGPVTYIGGNFSYVGPNTGKSAPLSLATGEPIPPLSRINNTVEAVVPDGSGGWYIGGSFVHVCGVERGSIAHILADGGLDILFNPNADAQVYALALSGGVLYVGGAFTNIGGQQRNYIAALDATTGLATSWNPNADSGIFGLLR